MKKNFTDYKRLLFRLNATFLVFLAILMQASCGKENKSDIPTATTKAEMEEKGKNADMPSESKKENPNSENETKMESTKDTTQEMIETTHEETITSYAKESSQSSETVENIIVSSENQTQSEEIEESISSEEVTTALEGAGYIPPSANDLAIGENTDEFFRGSVFIGDSVMKGFRNYIAQQEAGFFGEPQFLTSGSYSLRMAFIPINANTIHPIYNGEQHLIEDSIQMMGAKKVFLCLGLNDLGLNTPEYVSESYQKLIGIIKQKSPETSVYVISTTYMQAGSERQDLNNTNIRKLNQYMKEYCDGTGEAGYIELADYLMDESGALKEEYCSDDYVHQTTAAYQVWIQVLRAYATANGSEAEIIAPETTIEETHIIENKENTSAETSSEAMSTDNTVEQSSN